MKLHRLLAITMLLLSRKRMSGQELADRFEVSLRTIYRDLETISRAGIPVISYAGADGGYEIMDQYRIDRQMVTLEELHSIVIALRGCKHLSTIRIWIICSRRWGRSLPSPSRTGWRKPGSP
ncbi:HTH domain-containing protein [Paenibacillus sp. P26]|nr:HTH domain-containing protein [Paenibacillus sp. P26]